MELAVLHDYAEAANEHLGDARARMREDWEGSSTANNLMLIRDARLARRQEEPWLDAIIRSLDPKILP